MSVAACAPSPLSQGRGAGASATRVEGRRAAGGRANVSEVAVREASHETPRIHHASRRRRRLANRRTGATAGDVYRMRRGRNY
jgi:hypothetical protein